MDDFGSPRALHMSSPSGISLSEQLQREREAVRPAQEEKGMLLGGI